MMTSNQISANFKRSEFACKCGCGFDTVDVQLLDIVQAVREHFGEPFDINSGCRCKAHNATVGGGSRSQHLLGRAADIDASSGTLNPDRVAEWVMENFPHISVGRYNTFTHVDSRTNDPAFWDERT